LRWNKVVVVVVISCQNKKIIALVDIVLVAIGIGGMIPLNQTVSLARNGEWGIDPGMP
jgi:hypothetical protein